MLMRIMRYVVAILAVISVIAFLVVYIVTSLTADKTIPTITVPDGVFEITVDATDGDLLRDITAFDEKDGDLSNSVLVESISRFSETGYCKVTYAVSDMDNHVATATRQIHYMDYTPPKFTMKKPLVFSIDKSVDVVGIVGAKDCLDGDISQNVIIYSPDFKDGEVGNYSLQATVKNSKGDISDITLPMSVIRTAKSSPEIVLSEYLIYVDIGTEEPKWTDYIEETYDSRGEKADLSFDVKTDFDKDKPGMYAVNFYGKDSFGVTGYTALIVVVE